MRNRSGLPIGYYASGTNPKNLHEVMAVLMEMRSRLHRPQFTAFLKNRCLHGTPRKRRQRATVTDNILGKDAPAPAGGVSLLNNR
jgi:hypothetical protein